MPLLILCGRRRLNGTMADVAPRFVFLVKLWFSAMRWTRHVHEHRALALCYRIQQLVVVQQKDQAGKADDRRNGSGVCAVEV